MTATHAEGADLVLDDVGYAYRWLSRRLPVRVWPLHHATATFRSGTVTGLLGRNGSGKSTLLDVASGLRRARAGTVHLGSQALWDESASRGAVALLGTRRGLVEDRSLSASLDLWSRTRPRWSTADARRALELFEVEPDARLDRLSQGQRSAVDAAFALACHAPVLLLDEVHLGMDAVVRRRFWTALLDLYLAERPSIVIASHEVAEVEDLLEDVIVLSRGTVAVQGAADELREAATPPGAALADLTDVLAAWSSPRQAPASSAAAAISVPPTASGPTEGPTSAPRER